MLSDWRMGSMLTKIRPLAERNGWAEINLQSNIKMVSYARGAERINIYLSKMTVSTCVDHPTKGKTQLFRRNVDMGMLEKIFRNPRVHTARGYYRRDGQWVG